MTSAGREEETDATQERYSHEAPAERSLAIVPPYLDATGRKGFDDCNGKRMD
jgi:hypothetical protein